MCRSVAWFNALMPRVKEDSVPYNLPFLLGPFSPQHLTACSFLCSVTLERSWRLARYRALNKCWFQIPGRDRNASAVLKADPSADRERAVTGAAIRFCLVVQCPFFRDTRYIPLQIQWSTSWCQNRCRPKFPLRWAPSPLSTAHLIQCTQPSPGNAAARALLTCLPTHVWFLSVFSECSEAPLKFPRREPSQGCGL